MAIPLSMPNSDDIDDSHRLDLLLEQLLIMLRQVLIHRRRIAAAAVSRTSAASSHGRRRHEAVDQTIRTNVEEQGTSEGIEETRVVQTEEEVGEGEVTTTATTTASRTSSPAVQFPLPDLVLDSSTSGKESSRTARTYQGDHRIQCYHHHHHHRHLHAGSPTSWVDDGGELIRLAGQLLHQARSTTKEP